MQIFSYQNCLGQRAPHQQRTKERELFTRMNDHRLPVSGVHFSVAPVALKFDWTVKLSGHVRRLAADRRHLRLLAPFF
ncbi:hypothetical protein T03_1024 [Trichinella britovi]|uniref:Uncharacterized protein n=1 Tax=Trichinella britovi TaxID=45882 RepID=A0A0V1D6E0_TRIBR|nr:hypothetical protein T03_1024 [Trichinella britovi]